MNNKNNQNKVRSVRLKQSLGTVLLRLVFSCYFVVTVLITLTQLRSEFNHTKEKVLMDLIHLEETFKENLGLGIWDFNLIGLNDTLFGIDKIESVVGARILNLDKEIIASIGEYVKNKDLVSVENQNFFTHNDKFINKIFFTDKRQLYSLYEYSFPIYYYPKISGEKVKKVGTGSFYTSEKVFLQKVKHGFFIIVINSIFKTIALWIIFYYFAKKIVTNPLNRISTSIYNIDTNRPEKDAIVDEMSKREDEIGVLASAFGRMIMSVRGNLDIISDLNENLEQKIVERTKDIQSIFSNIKYGVLIIKENWLIHEEYSKHLEEIYETKKIAGEDFSDFLFTQSNLNENDIGQINASIKNSFGFDEFAFIVNAHLLPKEIIFKNKILELEWQPIFNEKSLISRIMLVIKDATEFRKLELQAKIKSEEIEIISQVLNVGVEKVKDFITNSNEYLEENKQLMNENNSRQINERIILLFRNFHTIKGNARTYNLTYIVNDVHLAEGYCDEVKKDSNLYNSKKILDFIQKICDKMALYENIIQSKLKLAQSISTEDLNFIRAVENLYTSTTDNHKLLDGIHSLFEKREYRPLKSIINDEIKSMSSIAISMKKEIPEVVIQDKLEKIHKKNWKLIKDVITHMLRNAIDHGIESTEMRIQKNKTPKGTIFLNVEKNKEFVQISMGDDGQGLNIEALRKKGKELGSIRDNDSDEKIAQLIFASGVSTASKVTDISGRGVGMDAVKSFIEGHQGSIELQLNGEDLGNGFRKFNIVINIPA